MESNKLGGMVAGAIVGFLTGMVFYIMPAKCLITGPLPDTGSLFIDQDLQKVIIMLSVKYGGLIGMTIGIIGGLTIPTTLPRGHMSKSISCMNFLVCTIVAFVQHGHFLSDMTGGRIAMTLIWVVFSFMMTIPFGAMASFVESIRE